MRKIPQRLPFEKLTLHMVIITSSFADLMKCAPQERVWELVEKTASWGWVFAGYRRRRQDNKRGLLCSGEKKAILHPWSVNTKDKIFLLLGRKDTDIMSWVFTLLTIRCRQKSFLSPYRSIRIEFLYVKIHSIVQITDAIIKKMFLFFKTTLGFLSSGSEQVTNSYCYIINDPV